MHLSCYYSFYLGVCISSKVHYSGAFKVRLMYFPPAAISVIDN